MFANTDITASRVQVSSLSGAVQKLYPAKGVVVVELKVPGGLNGRDQLSLNSEPTPP
jgi:hypothetical protein